MPEISIEVEVWCSCGEGLCGQTTDAGKRGRAGVSVEPCGKCLGRAEQEGHDRGFEEAREQYQSDEEE